MFYGLVIIERKTHPIDNGIPSKILSLVDKQKDA